MDTNEKTPKAGFMNADFGDKRLNKRLQAAIESLTHLSSGNTTNGYNTGGN
jgi:hypothetical protein